MLSTDAREHTRLGQTWAREGFHRQLSKARLSDDRLSGQ
jgi:hypothetical protein